LKNSVVKLVLGVVATGSFAIAFGQEKFSVIAFYPSLLILNV
jgi:endonuclease G